jgi:hypothetical protein
MGLSWHGRRSLVTPKLSQPCPMMVVHAEVLKEADKDRPDQVRLTLVRKPPGNAELPA